MKVKSERSYLGMDEVEARRRMTQVPVARLATVRPDGRPHLVPVTFAVSGQTLVTAIDQKPKSTTSLQRLENIGANPWVSLLVDHYADDWSRLWWVRVDGTARVVEAGPDRDHALELLTARYDQYHDDPPQGPAIVVEAHHWRGWSAR